MTSAPVPTDHAARVAPRPAPGILARLGLHRPEMRAWVMYDWANSAFMTTVMTAVFPIYFVTVAARGFPAAVATAALRPRHHHRDARLVAVLSPDPRRHRRLRRRQEEDARLFARHRRGHHRRPVLRRRAATGCWAALLFILANIGVTASFVFYESLLPHIASEEEIDRVSTAGYALGYLGGGLLLALNLWWIQKPETLRLPPTRSRRRACRS